MSKKLGTSESESRFSQEMKCLTQVPEKCPQCGCKRLWKNGHREGLFGTLQRYSCRECGLRFTKW